MRRRNGQRGSTTVEFALVVIPLMMSLMAILDLGRALWAYSSVGEMAREGARYASLHGSSSASPAGPTANDSAVTTAARAVGVAINTSMVTVNSTWLDSSNAKGSRVQVTTSYTYNSIVSSLLPFTTLNVQATSTMVVAY